MHPMAVFTLTLLFGGLTVVGVASGPIGRSIAARILGRHATEDSAEELGNLRQEMAALRDQVSEQAERLDFAERVLAQAREKGLPPPPKG
jgi:hypothetical protein